MTWLKSQLAVRMAACTDGAGRWALAKEVLESLGEDYQPEVVAALEGSLSRDGLGDLDNAASINTTALVARLATRQQDWPRAEAAWREFIQNRGAYEALDLLQYARVLLEQGEVGEAGLALRRALEQRPGYNFFTRAEKFLRQLRKKADAIADTEKPAALKPWRQCRIAVLGPATVALFSSVLRTLVWRDRIDAEFYDGLYGSVDQEILDPSSSLAAFKPDIVVVLTQWRDLDLAAVATEPDAVVERAVSRFQPLWQALGSRLNCQVIQQAYDYPAADSLGAPGQSLAGGRAHLIERINRELTAQAPAHVSLLDTAAAQRLSPVWEEAMQWHSYQQHPATDALPVLAELHAAHIRAVLGLTRKVLVTDLDNTLWKGVIGEDGLEGIGIGTGSAAGEAYASLQAYMLELKERGILLAVCSKNNQADAEAPFREHAGMVLKREDFAAFKANWQDKATNLREIARELSLGLESFVFIDDSPIEREWVRSQLPQVAVVEPGETVFSYRAALDAGRHFFILKLSKEDLARADSYQAEAVREQLKASAVSVDEFLAQLQLKAKVDTVGGANLARVTQLINKTNQFNLTTRRYTEAQVEAAAANENGWAAAFSMEDRMGNYGLTGVVIAQATEAATWDIDTWLMSCRVLGRQMEKFMFDQLVAQAMARGVRTITGLYRPTEKNGLVKELYPQFGFTLVEESAAGQRYRYEIPSPFTPTATHVQAI